MLCLWISKSYYDPHRDMFDSNYGYRYEIEEGAPGWADAEKQVLNATKSGKKNPVVSVKSTKTKRKAGVGETAAEIYAEEMGEKAHKKSKKGSKKEH
jgi:N-acetyltransferase 10